MASNSNRGNMVKSATTMSIELKLPEGEAKVRRLMQDSEMSGSNLSRDEHVMAKFGKKQQLKRRFKSLSSIGLICGLMLTWISVLVSLQWSLANGGTAGTIYGFLAAWAGVMTQALIMAEMASMIPLAGGPFNWVAVLCPASCRKYLSYTAGWMTVIGYQAFVSAVCYTNAVLIQGLVILNYPDYEPRLWHATLLFYAIISWAVFVNTYLGRILPRMESLSLILYILAFFAVFVPLAYLPKHRTAKQVFTEFQNLGGWSTSGLSFFVGWWASYSSFVGADGADHVAEEIHDSAKVIPFTIWSSVLFNGVLGLCMLLVVLFCIQDVEVATRSATGFPIMDIFVRALDSLEAGSAMITVMIVVDVFSTTSCVATASRTLWAFSRENGLPGSKFLVKVNPKTRLPINAIMTTFIINCLLALISIGSSAGYNAFYSVAISAYYASFLIAAAAMLHKRLTTPASEIPWGPFRLRWAGVPLNVISILYTLLAMFFSFWPNSVHPTPVDMNYSTVIFGAAVIFSSLFWVLHGRKVYTGPIWEL